MNKQKNTACIRVVYANLNCKADLQKIQRAAKKLLLVNYNAKLNEFLSFVNKGELAYKKDEWILFKNHMRKDTVTYSMEGYTELIHLTFPQNF